MTLGYNNIWGLGSPGIQIPPCPRQGSYSDFAFPTIQYDTPTKSRAQARLNGPQILQEPCLGLFG
ncbi:hypothetical protein AG1IA_10152 [Rhizoctonia solani AG-1 IA]|uniref:Uncharacterized protein n=1 Tax=Thanatephorus cucumeris (strain AG1-IA) TaxID=983506 RepID=L8WGD0_THACA|nr:hypothetical protein AG1IA_10152 [Rhizoctonia solani AG-1 IA]